MAQVMLLSWTATTAEAGLSSEMKREGPSGFLLKVGLSWTSLEIALVASLDGNGRMALPPFLIET